MHDFMSAEVVAAKPMRALTRGIRKIVSRNAVQLLAKACHCRRKLVNK
jgi:hypothetical protein